MPTFPFPFFFFFFFPLFLISTFISILVDKGSDVPERFGCCHGKEQARGVVAQFLGRRVGRALLRGAVRFRHVALAAVGGVESRLRREELRGISETSGAPLAAPGCPTTRLALG